MPSSTSSKLANIRQRLIQILASLPLDPIITGSLLLALTRGSPKLQSTLLRPFDNNILSKNRATRLATAVTVLKVLFSLGLINRINKFLNYCAFNNWYIHPNRRPGPAWQFGGVGDKEIVLITGGCSGIGAQLVRDFAGKAKIVVVDISDLPEEFKTSTRASNSLSPNPLSFLVFSNHSHPSLLTMSLLRSPQYPPLPSRPQRECRNHSRHIIPYNFRSRRSVSPNQQCWHRQHQPIHSNRRPCLCLETHPHQSH